MDMQQGGFGWNELATRDAGAAKAFYGEVLGWVYESNTMPDGREYTTVKAGDRMVGGMLEMDANFPPGVPSHWMAYISVDDIDAALAKVEANGGKVLYPRTDVPVVGAFATIQDPTGAAVSLMQWAPQSE